MTENEIRNATLEEAAALLAPKCDTDAPVKGGEGYALKKAREILALRKSDD